MGGPGVVVVNQSSGTALRRQDAARMFPGAELVDGETEDVRVNGEVSVNNSSVGQYPAFVRQRDEAAGRWPRSLASTVAAWRQLARNHQLRVSLAGAS